MKKTLNSTMDYFFEEVLQWIIISKLIREHRFHSL